MDDYEAVLRHIDRLEAMIPSALFAGDNWDFEALWQQIRKTGAAFRGVRFPTQDDHQEAWSRFQSLVLELKNKQKERQSNLDQRRETSQRLRDDLIRRAQNALPDSGLARISHGD